VLLCKAIPERYKKCKYFKKYVFCKLSVTFRVEHTFFGRWLGR